LGEVTWASRGLLPAQISLHFFFSQPSGFSNSS
jgi:hypothetical protein